MVAPARRFKDQEGPGQKKAAFSPIGPEHQNRRKATTLRLAMLFELRVTAGWMQFVAMAGCGVSWGVGRAGFCSGWHALQPNGATDSPTAYQQSTKLAWQWIL